MTKKITNPKNAFIKVSFAIFNYAITETNPAISYIRNSLTD